MLSAIIGYTGFVGTNLRNQAHFDDNYNSKNIESIKEKKYDLLVCAGTPAEKWRANKEPEKDLDNIKRLITNLGQVSVCKFVLISTVDVYPNPILVNEDSEIDIELSCPYGKNRFELEKYVKKNFNSLIVRLPALFGKGLKKNVIFDLINNQFIEQICPESIYQFYNIDNLWNDILIALNNDIKIINFATDPTSVREIASEAFGLELNNQKPHSPVRYDFRTKFSQLYNCSGGYIYLKHEILTSLKKFVLSVIGSRE